MHGPTQNSSRYDQNINKSRHTTKHVSEMVRVSFNLTSDLELEPYIGMQVVVFYGRVLSSL